MDDAMEKDQRRFGRRCKIFSIVAVVAIALALALGLGLGLGLNRSNSSNSSTPAASSSAPNNTITNTTSNTNVTGPWWTPSVGATWQIEISYAVNDTTPNALVWDIDLFINNASTVSSLHSQNRKVICYFSAGSYENFRPDSSDFQKSDYGNPLDGWPGEWWLNTNSSNVRNIMLKRLDLAVSMNCDGVDPDNIDGYDNANGLGLTQADAVDYVTFLAEAAHSRNLSIGLKNGKDIVNSVIGEMQWEVNESCLQYNECNGYQAFIAAGKPVFHIEYPPSAPDVSPATKASICDAGQAAGFSTILKNMALDNWLDAC